MGFQVNEVQRSLKGADYPMSGRDLAQLAKRNGADQELVDALAEIKHKVDGPNGVMKELKGKLGGRTPGPHKSEERHYKNVESPSFQVKDVQRYLKGAEYPMTGEQLAELARRNGADKELVELLHSVGTVDGPNGVMKQLKGHLGGQPVDR
jgi:hypothetical protein